MWFLNRTWPMIKEKSELLKGQQGRRIACRWTILRKYVCRIDLSSRTTQNVDIESKATQRVTLLAAAWSVPLGFTLWLYGQLDTIETASNGLSLCPGAARFGLFSWTDLRNKPRCQTMPSEGTFWMAALAVELTWTLWLLLKSVTKSHRVLRKSSIVKQLKMAPILTEFTFVTGDDWSVTILQHKKLVKLKWMFFSFLFCFCYFSIREIRSENKKVKKKKIPWPPLLFPVFA